MRELGLKIQQVICNRKEKANLNNCNDSMEFAKIQAARKEQEHQTGPNPPKVKKKKSMHSENSAPPAQELLGLVR